jgi:hypothetical protein
MANTTSDWEISTDVYGIVNTVDRVKSRYIDDETETTLALGIFGFLGDIEAKKIQTSVIMTGELGNEMFPTRAKLTKNVLTHATYSDISNINAIPAIITLNLGIRLDDLNTNMVEDEFTIDAQSPIYVGDYEFHLDYDIIVTRAKSKNADEDSYVYSAQYKLYDDYGNIINNRLSDVTNQYLITPFTIKIDNYYYLVMQVTIRQCTIETTIDKLVSDSIIVNKTYTFEFENQIADFDVIVTDNGKVYTMKPYVWGSPRNTDNPDEYWCWYLFINDSTIRISFDSASKIPGMNSDIEIIAYTTLGESGNFEYTKVDNSSEGFYFTISSTRLNYNNINCFAVAVTDSTNGKDRKSKEELQKLIPKAALSRGNITNETDLNNYFNLIEDETNRLLLQKKEDNQLARIWYGYFLIKDIYGNIIPTNTIKLRLDLESEFWYKSPDGRIIIPAGSGIKYTREKGYGELIDIADIPDPRNNEEFFGDEYWYVTLHNIVLSRDPMYCAFYVISVNQDSYYEFEWVNVNALTQMVANRLNYQRNLLTDQYRYRLTFSIAQSLLDDFGLYSKESINVLNNGGESTQEEVTTLNLKCIMVLYKDKSPYRWKECTFNESTYKFDGNFIYNFYVDFFTDNGLDDQNSIKINDLHVVGSSTDINYGYFRPITEAKLFILARFDSQKHAPSERGIGSDCLDYIAPGYDDWIVTNIYHINEGIRFYDNYTNLINTKVTALDEEGLNYEITGVPVVGGQYINIDLDESEDNADYVMDAIAEKKDYIDYCINLLENNMAIDFKFFNTYGPCVNYRTEDDDEIGHVDIELNFQIKLKSTSDIYTKEEISLAIKESIEDIYNLGDFHIPNLITQITNQFSERIEYIEFIGFNHFGPGVQHIIGFDNEDPHIPPEFLNVRNYYDEANDVLVPAINIEIV